MIYDMMRSRRSIRRFRPEPLPRELIERVLEAAVTAPSASNKQPWRFLVVTDAKTKHDLADAVRTAVDRVAPHVVPMFEQSFRTYSDYFICFEDAPVVIVPIFKQLALLSNMVDDTIDAQDRQSIEHMEHTSSIVSTSLAVQNLLLMAHELGLGATVMTGPMVALESVLEILGIPEGWEVVALVPLGFPAEEPSPTERKPVDRVVRWIDGASER